jgi:hypothetical protein
VALVVGERAVNDRVVPAAAKFVHDRLRDTRPFV